MNLTPTLNAFPPENHRTSRQAITATHANHAYTAIHCQNSTCRLSCFLCKPCNKNLPWPTPLSATAALKHLVGGAGQSCVPLMLTWTRLFGQPSTPRLWQVRLNLKGVQVAMQVPCEMKEKHEQVCGYTNRSDYNSRGNMALNDGWGHARPHSNKT